MGEDWIQGSEAGSMERRGNGECSRMVLKEHPKSSDTFQGGT